MNRSARLHAWAFCLLGFPGLCVGLDAPTDLVAIKSPQFPKTQIDVTWRDNSTDEAGFRIERCAGSGCTDFVFVESVGPNTTSVHNFDLPGGTTLRYRVQAFNDSGVSGYSNEAEATTDPFERPEPPTALAVIAAASDRVDLAWQDNSTIEEGFMIERCFGSPCSNFATVGLTGASVSSFSDTTVSSSSQYSYRVQAFNGDGVSSYSNVASTTTPDGPLPAPAGLTARAIKQGNRLRIELTWEDRSVDETSFELERCNGAGCTNFARIAITPAATTWFSDSSLSRRTTYRYRVRAVNSSKTSEYSNIATATTP